MTTRGANASPAIQNGSNETLNPGSDTARLDPNVKQCQASAPESSVWVSASAGTGKTKVLTDRVLRLLLPREDGAPGTKPHKILCLTFTKAGASEMNLRIAAKLSGWAVTPLEQLQKELCHLLNRDPSKSDIIATRRLFAEVVDAPGGLQIMTIHSFCQSVLGRFSLEAGLPPHFEVLEERQALTLLTQARDDVLKQAGREKASPLDQSVQTLAAQLNEEQFFSLIHAIASERRQLRETLERRFGVDGVHTELCRLLDVQPGTTHLRVMTQFCADSSFDRQALKAAATQLSEGKSETEKSLGTDILDWLSRTPNERTASFSAYEVIFFTSGGSPRSQSFPGAETKRRYPDCETTLRREAERLLELKDRLAAITCAQITGDLIRVGAAIIERYQDIKSARAALDFDDLIFTTLDLLENRTAKLSDRTMPGWVLYKLDQGLDHILIDEAQDTNPEQWKIIDALCTEFYAGQGAGAENRTIFTVGDEKQSIYSFQRASPEEFTRMHHDFARKINAAQKDFTPVDLDISFRSTASVLTAVDAVFKNPALRQGMGDKPIHHETYRRGQAGDVELWPLSTAGERDQRSLWDPPVTISETQTGQAALAEKIAAHIQGWITGGEILPSHGRPIHPGDIMILVRTRTAFYAQLSKALKDRNIPVSGIDRLVLGNHIVAQDLLAFAEFALLPTDDLTLATILKSPLIGMNEEALYNLATDRTQTLWSALKDSPHKEVTSYLEDVRTLGMTATPFIFFNTLLQRPCPADSISGLRAIMGRLGLDAAEVLDELLNLTLTYEKDNIAGLQHFLHWQSRNETEVKRELNDPKGDGQGEVRIMTVHGSKGLQAPIVILPDTTRTTSKPPGQIDKRLLWPDKTNLQVPLFSPRKEADCALYAQAMQELDDRMEEEYRRLLYVAMTRAEDRLIVTGYETRRKPIDESWYNYIRAGLSNLPDIEENEGVLRLSNPQTKEPDRAPREKAAAPVRMPLLPTWALKQAAAEAMPPAPLVPSKPDEDAPPTDSPLSQSQRFRRGNITHKLLEILPALPPEKRESAAHSYLHLHAQDLKEDIRNSILSETMAILTHSEFAPIFGPGSLAEVPVTGLIDGTRVVSGQIDRLLVTKDTIWIVDYKTNRPPPRDEKDIPPAYRRQMQAYAATLARIYPGRAIKCALLWTDGPFLMPVPLESP